MDAQQQAQLERFVDDFLHYDHMTPLGVGPAAPAGYAERFAGLYPESVLELWRRYGFDGFSEGRWWFADPVAWEPAVAAWIDVLPLKYRDDYSCLAYNATGDMHLWGRESGDSLTISPSSGVVLQRDRERPSPDDRFASGLSTLLIPSEVGDDDAGRDLMRVALPKLGRLQPGQIYGYTPALGLGGPCDADHLEIHPAVEHVVLLAQLTQPIMLDDAAAGIAEQVLGPEG